MSCLLRLWFCKGSQDFLHRFLLLRLQSGEERAKKCFLIIVQIPATEVPSVSCSDAACAALYRDDGVRTRKHQDIALYRSSADTEFRRQILNLFLSSVADCFQHLLSAIYGTLHVLTSFCLCAFIFEVEYDT
jgi:hypothetical protein